MGVPYAEVIGDPVEHSKSPAIHEFWLAKLGLPYEYRKTRVAARALSDFFSQRRGDPDWCGCNVTMPHKRDSLRCLDHVAADAALLEAVNVVVREGRRSPRLIGGNTDWSGFIEPLGKWLEKPPTHLTAYVVGTGGAAAAVCYALNRAGFTIVNVARDHDKALALRHRLDLFDDDLIVDLDSLRRPGRSDPWGEDRLDLLVNATPLGMSGYPPLGINLDRLPPGLVAYDIVYHPLETPLLREARERGYRTVDGLAMLIGQAAKAFERFFVEPAPREHDAELRALLTR